MTGTGGVERPDSGTIEGEEKPRSALRVSTIGSPDLTIGAQSNT